MALDPSALKEAAEMLEHTRLEQIPLADLPDDACPETEAEGYLLQGVLRERLTAAGQGDLVGYKIGCTTPVMQEYLKIDHPCAGGLLSGTMHLSGVSLPHDGFVKVGVEGEIAMRLGSDLVLNGAPATREQAAAAVEALIPAIEIVDDRYLDFEALSVPTLIADDFFQAGCVLGEPLTDWQGLDLPGVAGTLKVNGSPVGSGSGADVLGHPLDALVWLANTLAEQGEHLRAGQIVLTGSVVKTHWLDAGDSVEVELSGLGQVTATFP